ncbi:MAG: RNA-binding S4 domain-containing protein [Muribaculaceae bacterium]|nr:RNA-binding S4 domain-containing protein [Muribaculaceae bacterium]
MENDNYSEQGEKKPKRPRIGAQPAAEASGSTARYDRLNNTPRRPLGDEAESERNTYPRRAPYQPRENQDGQHGGYQPRFNNRYNNDGANSYPRRNANYQGNSYPRRNYDYQPRAQHNDYSGDNTDGQQGYEGGYQPRRQQQSYPRQGNYQPRYNNNRPGGYNNGGNRYNNGGNRNYQPRYNSAPAGEGGESQEGQQREGGYQPRYNNRPGGYNNRQGGYNNRNNRQGGYNNRQGGYNGRRNQGDSAFPARGKSFTPRPKRIEYEQPVPDPNEEIRLNKYMANAGLCSRREADEFIQQGLVKVNGQVVTELGTKITAKDVVEYDEKIVTLESKCYILLNKPKDCVTTSDDPNGRLTVMDLVKGACNERIYPVGRLDRNTTGVLLLTNDGDLASKLTHPKYVKKKIYHVWCDKDISEDDMQRIADGIELEDGPIHADAISYATETDRNQAGIEIHSGRNRIVRRIFESLGYHVTKLDRVYFAGLTKKNLPRGRWRYLTQEEVNYLKMGSFE